MSADRQVRIRPAPGGCSLGHRDITAGTLGCIVRKDGRRLILSNNHVLANCNKARIGDPVLQPGTYDSGRVETDEIARLYEFVEVRMGGLSQCPVACNVAAVFNLFARLLGRATRLVAFTEPEENLVDCALAEPLEDGDVSDEILEVGIPGGLAEPELGMRVKKSGRTTGLTLGEVTQVEVTVNVDMGDGRYACFSDQFIVSGEFSQGGDSGSLILDEDNRAVGLLFAGGDGTTVGNRFSNVMQALKVTLD